jgi:hypothetical protein
MPLLARAPLVRQHLVRTRFTTPYGAHSYHVGSCHASASTRLIQPGLAALSIRIPNKQKQSRVGGKARTLPRNRL